MGGAGAVIRRPAAVSACASTALPEAVGAAVFAGAAVTTAVGLELADAVPAPFVPVTVTSIVDPRSEV